MQSQSSRHVAVCPNCQLTFIQKQRKERYCSVSCATTARNIARGKLPRPVRPCEQCKTPMTLRHTKDRRRFCSRSCATTFHETAKMIPTEQRFWSKVDKSGECWLWT